MTDRAPLVEDIQNYAQNIVDTVREPLLILDATLRVQSANRAFYQTFHVSEEETEGRLIYELGNGQWDIKPRRPSHADKRRARRRELLGDEIRAVGGDRANGEEIHALAERLLDLAA